MHRHRQAELDGVRAVAALLILLYHLAANTGLIDGQGVRSALFNAGQVGVALFFALSGLLLYRPWAKAALDGTPRPAAGRFLRRRAVRLLPAYWALVIAFMLLFADGHRTDPLTWTALLSLTHLYLPGQWWPSPLGPPRLGPIWSLTVEAAWYLALPLTAAVLGRFAGRARSADRRGARLLIAIGAYTVLSFLFTAALFATSAQDRLGILFPRYCAWFAVGMALAVLAEWTRSRPDGALTEFCRTIAAARWSCWLSALALYAIAGTALTGPRDFSSPDVLWTAELRLLVYGACALCFLAPVALSPADGLLARPVPRFLGEISYGIFLWQMPVVLTVVPLVGPRFLVATALTVPSTIAIAMLSHRLIERPVQAWTTGRPKSAPRPAEGALARPPRTRPQPQR